MQLLQASKKILTYFLDYILIRTNVADHAVFINKFSNFTSLLSEQFGCINGNVAMNVHVPLVLCYSIYCPITISIALYFHSDNGLNRAYKVISNKVVQPTSAEGKTLTILCGKLLLLLILLYTCRNDPICV